MSSIVDTREFQLQTSHTSTARLIVEVKASCRVIMQAAEELALAADEIARSEDDDLLYKDGLDIDDQADGIDPKGSAVETLDALCTWARSVEQYAASIESKDAPEADPVKAFDGGEVPQFSEFIQSIESLLAIVERQLEVIAYRDIVAPGVSPRVDRIRERPYEDDDLRRNLRSLSTDPDAVRFR